MIWIVLMTFLHVLQLTMTDVDVLWDFCNSDAVIPDDVIHCGGSCENNCGSTGTKCFCDKMCKLYGDCCRDFQEKCPQEFTQAQGVIATFPQQLGDENFACVSDVLAVVTCADGVTRCSYSSTLNDDVNTFVPMYDTTRNIHYVSGHCTVCNNAVNVIPWGVTLVCERHHSLSSNDHENANENEINSTEAFNQVRQSATCELSYSKPRGVHTRQCHNPDIISTCRTGCENLELIGRCESSALEFTYLGSLGPYRNPYCALCGETIGFTTADLSCTPDPDLIYTAFKPELNVNQLGGTFQRFSLTVVFDFDPRKGLVIGEHDTPECDPGEVYHAEEGACRSVTCPTGMVLEGYTCVPEISSIVAILTGTLKSQLPGDMFNMTQKDRGSLESGLLVGISHFLNSFDIEQLHLDVKISFEIVNDVFETEISIRCNCDFSKFAQQNNAGSMTEVDPSFMEGFMKVIREEVLAYIFDKNIVLERISTEMSFIVQNSSLSNAPENCVWLVYELPEVTFENDTIKIVRTGKTYNTGFFEVFNSSVIVCEENLDNPTEDTTQFVLGILTLVCISISIICLFVRILLQLCVSRFRTRPGRFQFHLTLAFLVAFIFLLVGPLFESNEPGCVAAAGLLCYGFFAAFTWMNIIAVDTWLAFRPSGAFTRSGDQEKSLIRHILIAWGVPLILVAIPLGLNYSNIVETYKPNFGGKRCWFTQRIALLTYFGLPLAISIILNIYLYIHTSINLHRAFSEERSRGTKKDHHFVAYVRLFVLMGITWIFGFLSAFLDQPAIDFVFVILTSLQGLFLFLSFVCNKHVLSELRKTFRNQSSSSSEKPTKDTPLSSKDAPTDSNQNKRNEPKLSNVKYAERSKAEEQDKNTVLSPKFHKSRDSMKERVVSQIRKFGRKISDEKENREAPVHDVRIDSNRRKRESIA